MADAPADSMPGNERILRHQVAIERAAPRLVVAVEAWVDRKREHPLGSEAGVDVTEIDEGPEKLSGGVEQQSTESDTCAIDERLAQPHVRVR